MRRLALIAGCVAALPAFSGCALFGSLRDRTDESPTQRPECQQFSQVAQAAMDRQDYERARVNLEALVNQAPGSAEARQRLGHVLQLQGKLAEAEASYRQALALDRDYDEALIGLGEVEAQLGRSTQALEKLDEAIEIAPKRAEAHFAHGKILESLGRHDEALADYFRALEFDPLSPPVILRVAALQLAKRETDQALARLDQLLELTPEDAEAHYQRGLAHLTLKHPAKAVADLQFAARRLPRRPDVLYHLALAYDAGHDTQAALEASERALKLSPNDRNARALSERLHR